MALSRRAGSEPTNMQAAIINGFSLAIAITLTLS
jgi:hypothetical protein